MRTMFACQWLTGPSGYAETIKCKDVTLGRVLNDGCHWSPSGRRAPLQLSIIWTDKGTIPTSTTLWVICTQVNRGPASIASRGSTPGFYRRVSATVAEHNGRFPFPTTFIDRSLSAMNGCKAKGGGNPELQVTGHGSGFTQAGRNRKKLHGTAWGGGCKTFSHFLKSMLARRQTYSVPRMGSQSMRLKLDVYCRGNEVYRTLLG